MDDALVVEHPVPHGNPGSLLTSRLRLVPTGPGNASDLLLGQLYAFLPGESWVRAQLADTTGPAVHAGWLEVGWAVRGPFRSRGFAPAIGRAGLAVAFEVQGTEAVVSCAGRRNLRSRAVMGRIGMRYAGEIQSPGVGEEPAGRLADVSYSVSGMLREDWDPSAGTIVAPVS